MEEHYETFTVLIARINRSIKRIKADEMADFELKGPHVSCLYYLSQQDGMTAAELMTEDKALGIYLAPYAFELKVLFVAAVLGIGYAINRRREQKQAH